MKAGPLESCCMTGMLNDVMIKPAQRIVKEDGKENYVLFDDIP